MSRLRSCTQLYADFCQQYAEKYAENYIDFIFSAYWYIGPKDSSGAGTIFGQGEQNWECQIDGIFIEFGPLFCLRNKRSLKKKVFTGFGPLFCPRIKRSLKNRSLPTSDCVCLAQNTVLRRGQNISMPPAPPTIRAYERLCLVDDVQK